MNRTTPGNNLMISVSTKRRRSPFGICAVLILLVVNLSAITSHRAAADETLRGAAVTDQQRSVLEYRIGFLKIRSKWHEIKAVQDDVEAIKEGMYARASDEVYESPVKNVEEYVLGRFDTSRLSTSHFVDIFNWLRSRGLVAQLVIDGAEAGSVRIPFADVPINQSHFGSSLAVARAPQLSWKLQLDRKPLGDWSVRRCLRDTSTGFDVDIARWMGSGADSVHLVSLFSHARDEPIQKERFETGHRDYIVIWPTQATRVTETLSLIPDKELPGRVRKSEGGGGVVRIAFEIDPVAWRQRGVAREKSGSTFSRSQPRGESKAVSTTQAARADEPPRQQVIPSLGDPPPLPTLEDIRKGRHFDWLILKDDKIIVVEPVEPRPDTLAKIKAEIETLTAARGGLTTERKARQERIQELQWLTVSLLEHPGNEYKLKIDQIKEIRHFEDLVRQHAAELSDADDDSIAAKEKKLLDALRETEKEDEEKNVVAIPAGMRVVSLPAPTDEKQLSLIVPGGTIAIGIEGPVNVNDRDVAFIDYIADDATIFAVDNITSPSEIPDGHAPKTLSVLVTTQQADRIAEARKQKSVNFSAYVTDDEAATGLTLTFGVQSAKHVESPFAGEWRFHSFEPPSNGEDPFSGGESSTPELVMSQVFIRDGVLYGMSEDEWKLELEVLNDFTWRVVGPDIDLADHIYIRKLGAIVRMEFTDHEGLTIHTFRKVDPERRQLVKVLAELTSRQSEARKYQESGELLQLENQVKKLTASVERIDRLPAVDSLQLDALIAREAGNHTNAAKLEAEAKELLGAAVGSEEVLVAATAIQPGNPLSEENTKWKKLDAGTFPQGVVTVTRSADQHLDIYERALTVYRGAGDWIMMDHLAEKGAIGAAAVIPPGMRVATIPADTTTHHNELLRPGDRIDVFLSWSERDPQTGLDVENARPILEYVEIFAIDSQINARTQGEGAKRLRNISLLVTPEQSMILQLAKKKGTISTVLRNKDDKDPVSLDLLTDDFLRSIGTERNTGIANETNDAPSEADLKQLKEELQRTEIASTTRAMQLRELDSSDEPPKDDIATIEAELKRLVTKAFELRWQLQDLRLKKSRTDLLELEAKHQRRKEVADQIIERRLEALHKGDETAWLQTNFEVDGSIRADTNEDDFLSPGQHGLFKQPQALQNDRQSQSLSPTTWDSTPDSNLDGKWRMVEWRGSRRDEDGLKWTLQTDASAFTMRLDGSEGSQSFRRLLDVTSNPRRIRLAIGNQTVNSGCYRVDSDRLTIAWAPADKPEQCPGDFSGSTGTIQVWQRAADIGSGIDEKLLGDWKLVSASGTDLLALKPNSRLCVEDGQWKLSHFGRRKSMRIVTNAETNLKQIDLAGQSAFSDVFSGIYKIENDVLTVAWAPYDGSAQRPDSFINKNSNIQVWKQIEPLPTFETPEELLDFFSQTTRKDPQDIEGFVGVLTDDEAARFAGVLIASAGMMNRTLPFMMMAEQLGEDEPGMPHNMATVTEISALLRDAVLPGAPPQAIQAFEDLIKPDISFLTGQFSMPTMDVETFSEKLKLAGKAVGDPRSFVVQLMNLMERMSDDNDNEKKKEQPKPDWAVTRDGDKAIAINQAGNDDNDLTSGTMELVLTDGTWKISKIIDEANLKELAASVQMGIVGEDEDGNKVTLSSIYQPSEASPPPVEKFTLKEALEQKKFCDFDLDSWSMPNGLSFLSIEPTLRTEFPEWLPEYIAGANDLLEGGWGDREYRLLKSLDPAIHFAKEDDDWPLQAIGKRVADHISEYSTSPAIAFPAKDSPWSAAMLSRAARINGKLPVDAYTASHRGVKTREKLELLEKMLNNNATDKWIDQETIRLANLLQEAPVETLRLLTKYPASTHAFGYKQWLFTLASPQFAAFLKSTPAEAVGQPMDVVLLSVILAELTGTSEEIDDRIALILDSQVSSRGPLIGLPATVPYITRQLEDILASDAFYRRGVIASLKRMYQKSKSENLKNNIAQFAPAIPVAANSTGETAEP